MQQMKNTKMRELIQVLNLKKYFSVAEGFVRAVDDVTFDILEGETVGLVGESGCGKSTVGRTILNLIRPTSGKLLYQGQNIFEMDRENLRVLRKQMGIIFQDPYSSLNPRMNLLSLIGEPLAIHLKLKRSAVRDRVATLIEEVGLKKEQLNRYPHQFSGGQRQRIAIARSLALDPQFLVLDEPTSALDVSVQAQVLNLIKKLQMEKQLTYLFISHDLTVIEHIADHIVIMYLGKIVETGPTADVFNHPNHPYTRALISAIPVPDPFQDRQKILLEGDVPSPINPPAGCRFHTRCPVAQGTCGQHVPEMRTIGKQQVACHCI